MEGDDPEWLMVEWPAEFPSATTNDTPAERTVDPAPSRVSTLRRLVRRTISIVAAVTGTVISTGIVSGAIPVPGARPTHVVSVRLALPRDMTPSVVLEKLPPAENTIQAVLDRYRSAFKQQNLEFDTCSIDASGLRAEASCSGKATSGPKAGNKTTDVEARRWTFHLRKADEQWVIDSVDSR